jgi:hypothetical protein
MAEMLKKKTPFKNDKCRSNMLHKYKTNQQSPMTLFTP